MSEQDKSAVAGEHTPGLWVANGCAVYLGSAGGFDLRHCPAPEANARRIVACVNACDRLSTDELERFGLASAFGTKMLEIEHQRDQLQQLVDAQVQDIGNGMALLHRTQAERDKLLAALEKVVGAGDWYCTALELASAIDGYELEKELKAVIASVKGGA